MTYATDLLNSFPIPVIAPEIQKDGTVSIHHGDICSAIESGITPVTCNLRTRNLYIRRTNAGLLVRPSIVAKTTKYASVTPSVQ